MVITTGSQWRAKKSLDITCPLNSLTMNEGRLIDFVLLSFFDAIVG